MRMRFWHSGGAMFPSHTGIPSSRSPVCKYHGFIETEKLKNLINKNHMWSSHYKLWTSGILWNWNFISVFCSICRWPVEVNFAENKLYFEYKTEIEDYFYMAILQLDVFFLSGF